MKCRRRSLRKYIGTETRLGNKELDGMSRKPVGSNGEDCQSAEALTQKSTGEVR